MFERFVERRAEEALSDTPVVLIVGPRRAGKTTLARKMGEAGRTYITLDDQTVLEAAQSDPAGFIRGLDRAIIDEIQRAPDLLLAIKKTVDEDYRPGRFLLTGSANVLTLPRVADSLAGRMETIQMLPLARAEIEGRTPTFLEHLFAAGKLRSQREAILGDDLAQLVLVGGFPGRLTSFLMYRGASVPEAEPISRTACLNTCSISKRRPQRQMISIADLHICRWGRPVMHLLDRRRNKTVRAQSPSCILDVLPHWHVVE